MIWKIPKLEELKKHNFEDINPHNQNRLYGYFKRIFDLVFSTAMIMIFLPLWIVIALIIIIETHSNPIFKQERIGFNGYKFTLYKFRTMKSGAKTQEYSPKSLQDPRITLVGKLLRRTSLDEIPQFFNVLKGEMTFIGPRPEMSFIVEKYNEKQRKRLLVKPGITGLWQVMGRKDVPLHENVEYDLFYILNQSLRLDLIILLKTITVVVTGKGAY